MDQIVKTFCGYIFEDITNRPRKLPIYQINSIIIPSVECLKFFMVKILRIAQNLRKPRNFHPSKLIHYMVLSTN